MHTHAVDKEGNTRISLCMMGQHLFLEEPPRSLSEHVMLFTIDPPGPNVHHVWCLAHLRPHQHHLHATDNNVLCIIYHALINALSTHIIISYILT